MERRTDSFRKPRFIAAKLTFGDGRCRPCVIENLSDKGAKIDVGSTMEFPQEFHLNAEQPLIDVRARIAWRTGAKIGLRFLDEGS